MKEFNNLKTRTRLMVYTGNVPNEAPFCKGVATLLRGVEETGSLNASAGQIKMAYSKAWRIVKDAESSFGFLLIRRDGARGSTLTKEGRIILNAYEDADLKCSEYVAKRFAANLVRLQ